MATNKKATASGGKAEVTGTLREKGGKFKSTGANMPRYRGGKALIPLVKNNLGVPIRVTVTFHNPSKGPRAETLEWIVNPGEEYFILKPLQPYVRYISIEEVT